jgi:large subunit ribosomal protein L9
MANVDVILLERVSGLGQMGDVVAVKPGFARNFLLPQKKALRATAQNKAFFDKQKVVLEAQNLARKGEAEKVSKKMDGLKVVVLRAAAEGGQLYGSVSARDIADAVSALGFAVDRQHVVLNQAIKTLGLFPVDVALHPEVTIHVTVNVARSEDEAKLQAVRGEAVIIDPNAIEEDEAKPAEEANVQASGNA